MLAGLPAEGIARVTANTQRNRGFLLQREYGAEFNAGPLGYMESLPKLEVTDIRTILTDLIEDASA